MYKILKNTIEMDDYSVQKLSNLQPPEPFEWNTVEGIEIDVSDSAEYRGPVIPGANLEQKQLSGKNKFGVSERSGVVADVDCVFKDSEILINGAQTTGRSSSKLTFKDILPAGTYHIKPQVISGTCVNGPGGHALSIVITDTNNTKIVDKWLDALDMDFTLSEETQLNFSIWIPAGAQFNNYKVGIQIEEGSTATDYEPYCGGQASPNPDYPQEIKVVTGDNVVKHADVFNDGKIEIGAYNDLSFQARARFTNSKIPIGTSITIETNFDLSVYKWAVYESTKPLPVTQQISTNTGGWHTDTNIVKYTTANQYVNLNIARIDNRNMTIDEISKFRVTMYAQHQEEYKLDLWKENEFDSENATVMNALLSDGGSISANGSYRTVVVSTLPDTLYKISKNSGAFFRIADFANLPQTNDEYISRIKDDNAQFILFKTSHFANYLAITYWNIADTISEQEMLESIKIQQPLELCKIGDSKDILFKNEVGDENYNAELESGAWYEKSVIKKNYINGSESWRTSIVDTSVKTIRFARNVISVSNSPGYCNKLHVRTIEPHTDTEYLYLSGTVLYININKERLSELSVNGFISFLQENNIINYYIPLTSEYTKITDPTLISQLEALRKAKWFKGVNHWWTETNNLEPVLKGTYRQAINE